MVQERLLDKIYAISIPRYKARNLHIKNELSKKTALPWDVLGVDALDLEGGRKYWCQRESLRDSEVGCALSHASACKRLISDGVDYALIVEDDVVLPESLDLILQDLAQSIRKGEVISLYNRTMLPEKFSSVDSESVGDRWLVYPMETRFMRTAAAYFLDKQAAERIAEFNVPVRVVADDWASFYQSEVIRGIRLLHPIPISLKPFESTLSYDRKNIFKNLLQIIMGFSTFRKLRALRRSFIERRREKNVVLVNLRSDQVRSRSS